MVSRMCRAAATSPAHNSILIAGPSGSGKTLVARSFHTMKRTAGAPFVHASVVAGDPNSFVTELFGFAPHTFADAKAGADGIIGAKPSPGTIFLDEIDKLPSSLQGRLLQCVEERTYRRKGESTILKVPENTQFVFGSNNLDCLRDPARFLPDLYARIAGTVIEVPPLAQRPEDVPDYCWIFAWDVLRALPDPVAAVDFDAAAMERLTNMAEQDSYARNNLRELQAVVRNAFQHAYFRALAGLTSTQRAEIKVIRIRAEDLITARKEWNFAFGPPQPPPPSSGTEAPDGVTNSPPSPPSASPAAASVPAPAAVKILNFSIAKEKFLDAVSQEQWTAPSSDGFPSSSAETKLCALLLYDAGFVDSEGRWRSAETARGGHGGSIGTKAIQWWESLDEGDRGRTDDAVKGWRGYRLTICSRPRLGRPGRRGAG